MLADATVRHLSLELEKLALKAVRAAYDDLNRTYFRDALRRPVFTLADTVKRLGQYDAHSRNLELSRTLLVQHSWGALIEVLKHEMAHQYVHEILGKDDESAHGQSFRRVCEQRGFDARAAGVPQVGAESGPQMAVLSKIGGLLSLAQSSNEHEAQAAMNAAQRLMLKYNLSELEAGRTGAFGYRHLGAPSGRTNEAQRILASILADFFFVETIWVPVWRVNEGKRGSVLEVCGSSVNLEMAHYVHSFLTHTAERLWNDHKKANGTSAGRDHQAYLAGVMAGFREKLTAERRSQKKDGLVWVGDPELKGFLKLRHPHMRYSRYLSSSKQAAHAQGRAAGSRIVLHKGVTSGAKGSIKLLRG
ncbi:MAG TPA: DUF2786 domain-containing protein [Polyangiaceae bacterium]|nr:DUF2786 domain-containing protein [Polyangiaceae bacterium]